MKFWLSSRYMLSSSNRNRTIFSDTLHSKRRFSILKSSSHLPRRKLWVTPTNSPRQWRFLFLYLLIWTHRTRNLLRIILIYAHLISWGNYSISHHSNSFSRIRTSLGTNIILRGHCNHQPNVCNSICRNRPSTMNLRGIRSK